LDVTPSLASVSSIDGLEVSFSPLQLSEDKTSYIMEITLVIREDVKKEIISRAVFPDVFVNISMYGEHICTLPFQIKIPRVLDAESQPEGKIISLPKQFEEIRKVNI
jgi:hypothetical protein